MPNLINACSSKEKQTTNNNGWMSYSTWTHLALENWHASFIQMDDIIHLFPLRVYACARPLAYMDKTLSAALNIAVPMHVEVQKGFLFWKREELPPSRVSLI